MFAAKFPRANKSGARARSLKKEKEKGKKVAQSEEFVGLSRTHLCVVEVAVVH